MKSRYIRKSILFGLMALSAANAADTAIPIEGNDKGRTFDGIGALSAGASSRLLIE